MCRKFSFLVSFVLVLCLFGNAWGLVWGQKDIGNPGIAGSASEAAGTWTISGSGHDIWGNADGFHYVYRPLSGDGSLRVNLVSMDLTSGWAKVGPAVRETLESGSRHAMTAMTGANGIQFVWRMNTNQGSDVIFAIGETWPIELRITRSGDNFISEFYYERGPGVFLWSPFGRITIPMNTDVTIGMVVCATNNGALNTAVIDNVILTAPPYEKAWDMSPPDGSTRMPLTPTLSWMPGDSATSHDVLMGTDPAALTLVATKALGDESYTPAAPLTEGTVYYWQIVEQPGAVAGLIMSFRTAPYEGTGEPNDPYLIYTAEQMNEIGLNEDDWDKCFKLMADIDLSNFTGTTFNIIGTDYDNAFTGVFNGNGHTISNFTYMPSGGEYIGLFRYVGNWGANAVIKDLGLIAPDVEAGTENWGVGSLVGYLRESTITACYVEGATVSGEWFVGGLVGSNRNGTITNCYATGSVEGNSSVGGLVGYNWGTISDCYSTGSVSGDNAVGGLVGYNWGGMVTDSFWDIETSGQTTSAGGTGKTTAQMQMQITFSDAGWDFVGETVNGIEDIWFIPQQDYPHLWWEEVKVPMKMTPRTLNCRSYGNWVKAHLILPEGFTVADVDSNRPAVLRSFGIESAPLYVFVNKDKLVEIEAVFERQAVCSLSGDWPQELTVAVFLADGNIFLGTSKVRINHPGLKVIEELAWYWLNEDCVHPDFCNQIDMNRDSLVNLDDYALLMNINVEFVNDE